MKLQVKKCPERKIDKSFDLIKNSITRLQIFRATTKFVVIPRVYFVTVSLNYLQMSAKKQKLNFSEVFLFMK